MAVVAKPDMKRSKGKSATLFAAIALLLLVIVSFSSKATASQERAFANPADADKPLLRHGTPVERHPDENSSGQISFDLADLKNGGTGTIVFEIVPEWAPLGVAHFWELVESGFYKDCRLFRVIPGFVAQFGMSGDPAVQRKWTKKLIKDDKVLQTNKRGTLTYATSGKDSRTTQLFINFGDNKRLDSQGFAPIGRIVKGEEFLDQIQDKYREKPGQGQITRRGNEYLKENFPDLTYIQATHGMA